MGADFTPTIPDSNLNPDKGSYTGQGKLKFYCQKVLPLVYDDSLSYYETICKVVQKLNELAEKYNEVDDLINNLEADLTVEVTRILNEWYQNGKLEDIIGTALDNIQGDVDDLSDDIDDINSSISDISDSITSLTAGVGAAAAMAEDAAEAALKHSMNGKYCLLLGNSYGYGTGADGHGWIEYFQNLTGCLGETIALRGGDFCSPGNNNTLPEEYRGKTYIQAMNYAAANNVHLNTSQLRNLYEYVIVGGCYNDREQSGVQEAVTAFVNRARELFPNAKIWIIPLYPGRRINAVNVYNVGVKWVNGATAAGAATSSNTFNWFFGRSDLWHTDDVHLNALGYAQCAKYMAALIDGWDGLTETEDAPNATLATGMITHGFRCFRKGDRVSIGGAIEMPSDQPVAGRVTLATLDASVLPSTIKFFAVYCYKAGNSALNTLATAAISASTGALTLEATNADIQAGAYVYFAIDYSIIV